MWNEVVDIDPDRRHFESLAESSEQFFDARLERGIHPRVDVVALVELEVELEAGFVDRHADAAELAFAAAVGEESEVKSGRRTDADASHLTRSPSLDVLDKQLKRLSF